MDAGSCGIIQGTRADVGIGPYNRVAPAIGVGLKHHAGKNVQKEQKGFYGGAASRAAPAIPNDAL